MTELDHHARDATSAPLPENPLEHSKRHDALIRLLGAEPTAVYILSPGFSTAADGEKSTQTLRSPDSLRNIYGYIGGTLRVHALAALHEYFPDAAIVTCSITPQTDTTDYVSHAQIQERELREIWEKRNVAPPKEILRQEKSYSTITELGELVRLIIEKDWEGLIVATTNEYHIKRTEAMLERLPTLIKQVLPDDQTFEQVWAEFKQKVQDGIVTLRIQDSESICAAANPKFENVFDHIAHNEPWKTGIEDREIAEEKGYQALVDGSYQPQPLKARTE